jgi:hypothetical protein
MGPQVLQSGGNKPCKRGLASRRDPRGVVEADTLPRPLQAKT